MLNEKSNVITKKYTFAGVHISLAKSIMFIDYVYILLCLMTSVVNAAYVTLYILFLN